jgi:cell division protein FtsA
MHGTMSNFHAALEIGTTRTVLAIGEVDANGRLRITSHAEIPSTGVRKSQILDINQATQSIRSVLQKTEALQEASGDRITLGNAFLVVSGQSIRSDTFSASTQIEGNKVGPNEIDAVQGLTRELFKLPRDRELLDVIDQDFVVDRMSGVTSPRGLSGRVLSLNTLQIHADHNRIQDARTAADAARLEIRDPLYAVTCAADAVLEDPERKNGVLVLDLGGGSTGYAVYADGYAVSTGVFGVGGDHVTNDIALAFQTTNNQAERLKCEEASARVTADEDAAPRVRVERGDNTLMDNRTISRRALNTVVNARLLELFAMIRETLEEQDLLHRLHRGVVLTGGGARMRDIEPLAEQAFGTTVRLGKPIYVDGLEDADFPPAYAAVAGALLYAHRNYPDKSLFDGFFGRIFK